jgi:hypothetical protein
MKDLAAANKALKSGKFFVAERAAFAAVAEARAALDFQMMASALPVLRDARKQRVDAAIDASEGIRHMDEPFEEGDKVKAGCILVDPPFVGADARAIRLAALEQDVPVAILCREPLTQMRLRPIVAIGQITVRTRVVPPDDDDNPDLDWFLAARNELGETAIESLDTGAEILRQIDGLLDRLDSIPEHPRLHDALEEICLIAAAACEESPAD